MPGPSCLRICIAHRCFKNKYASSSSEALAHPALSQGGEPSVVSPAGRAGVSVPLPLSCFHCAPWLPAARQSVQSLSRVRLFATPWAAARQASLSITNSRKLLNLMSVKSAMPSNHLILCRPLLLLPSVFPSIRVFSNELALHIRWSKCWSFSFSISPSVGCSGLVYRPLLLVAPT